MAALKFSHSLIWLLLSLTTVLSPISSHPLEDPQQVTLVSSLPDFNSSASDGNFHASVALAVVTTPAQIEAHCDLITADAATINFCPSESFPTSVWQPFGADFAIGTPNDAFLVGCTVLVAFTTHGVHIAHYWEVPGFTTSFKTHVINFMMKGKKVYQESRGRGKRRKTLGPYPALLTEANLLSNSIVHILTTAANEHENTPNYRTKIKTIRAAIVGPQATTGGPAVPNAGIFKDAHIKEAYYHTPDGTGAQYILEFSQSERRLRAMMSGHNPRILFDKLVDVAWDVTVDGPQTAWSNLP